MMRLIPLAALMLLAGTSAAAQPAGSGTLVVVNKGAATASLIDLATGTIVATLPTGDGPHELVVSSDGRRAVTTNYGGQRDGNTLTVIDIPNARVERTIDLGQYRRPHGLAFLPGDSLVVVTSERTRNVVIASVIDGGVRRAVPTEQNGSHMLALVADGSRLYTGNIPANTVSEVDLRRGRTARTFPVPPAPEAITVTPDGSRVWVGSNNQGLVTVFETENGTTLATFDGFSWPYRILLTPDGRRALIPDLRGQALRVVDARTFEEIANLSLPGTGPEGIALDDRGRTAYLSLSQTGQIAVIDVDDVSVTGYLPAGPRPDGIGYSSLTVTGN